MVGDAVFTKLVDILGAHGGGTNVQGEVVQKLDVIANDAMHNLLVRNNPRPIDSPAQVREILDMAF